MNKIIAAWLIGLALILPQFGARSEEASPGDEIIGVWHTTGDRGDVKIFKRDGRYFGEVLNIAEPNWPANDKHGMGGKPKNDRYNPNPKLRDRPVIGIELMTEFVYARKNLWDEGKIYDPETGKTYKCKMILKSPNKLEVHGYIGISLFGRTVTWTRAEETK
ncbi:MAG TPA: DUF2147 domain-containing protein [Verrucomicrobiae bacterium]|jgi:uncharacterized protein (DUF2147 family)|nr:DUF2147 domain-containing protein [Verrucomicrobiae bacterium]